MLKKRSSIILYAVVTLALCILFINVAVWVVNLNDYHNSDFFTFWLSGRFALDGQDPYQSENWIGGHHLYGATWIPNATLVYPLPFSLFFIPFGLIPLYEAFVIWVGLSQAMILISILLLFRLYPNGIAKQYAFPLIAGIILFRPTIITLINGQLSGLFLLLLVMIIIFWEKGKWWEGSIFIPLLALKPNLGVPIIVLLFFYLVVKRKKSSIIVIFAGGLFLILVGMILDPNWIVHYWSAGSTKMAQTFGYAPSIWGLGRWMCDGKASCIAILGSSMSMLLLLLFGSLILVKGNATTPKYVVGLTIVLMLFLTPHTWPYDQILLVIPIFIITLGLANSNAKFLPTALIFLFLDVAALIILKINAYLQNEIWCVTLTAIVFFLLLRYQKYDHTFADNSDSP